MAARWPALRRGFGHAQQCGQPRECASEPSQVPEAREAGFHFQEARRTGKSSEMEQMRGCRGERIGARVLVEGVSFGGDAVSWKCRRGCLHVGVNVQARGGFWLNAARFGSLCCGTESRVLPSTASDRRLTPWTLCFVLCKRKLGQEASDGNRVPKP